MRQVRHRRTSAILVGCVIALIGFVNPARAESRAANAAPESPPEPPCEEGAAPPASESAMQTAVRTLLQAEVDTNPPPAASPDEKQAAEQKKEEATAGADSKSDYTAKNFSLLTGAVVLNPFEITKNANGDLELDKRSDTTANAFVEGGFRHRYAWRDRIAPSKEAAWMVADLESKLKAARKKLQDLRDKWDLAKARREETTRTNTEAECMDTKHKIAKLQQDKNEADGKQRASELAWQIGLRDNASVKCPACRLVTKCDLAALVPSDWTARMGFAFASGKTGAAGLPGASDFYGEVGTGVNLLRFDLPTSSSMETPSRGALSFESAASFTTDSSSLDVHERPFIGASLTFGVPLSLVSTDTEVPETKDGAPAPLKPAPIAELLTRVGAVWVETPQFKDPKSATSRVIKTENGSPDFEGQWGGGFDMELNVPVSEQLGYLVARGSINFGFDPNPWTLTLGYTIPISQFGKLVGGNGQKASTANSQ